MKDTYDFDNLIFQLTKNPRDIYIDFSKIDLTNFFNNNINYILKEDIINQQIQEVQYGQKVLDLFLSSQSNSQILYQDILNNVSNKWLYKQYFKKAIFLEDMPIIYYVYDLSNLESTNNMLLKILKYEYLKNKSNILQSYYNDFKTCAGYFKILINKNSKLPAAFLMCIDENFVNKRTIKHQLTHYFQAGLSVLGQLKNIDTSKLKDIPDLGFKKQQLIYLFEKQEFDAWILINLQNTLRFLYYIYYRKLKHQNQICFLTYKQFLKYFIYLIELHKDKITVDCKDWKIISGLLNNFLKRVDGEIAIKLAVASCYLNIQWNYLKNKILNDF